MGVKTMDESSLLGSELQKRPSAIGYGVSRALHDLCGSRAVLEARNEWFDVQEFADSGQCQATAKSGVHSQIETQWPGPGEGMYRRDCTAWFNVIWQTHTIEVVTVTWQDFPHHVRWQWIIAETMDVAEQF